VKPASAGVRVLTLDGYFIPLYVAEQQLTDFGFILGADVAVS
jgi:hypothetical protein